MKRITAIFGASLSLLVGLLLVSACGNILSPSVQPEENVQRGVTITIGGNRSHIRTLYPTAEFTKYTLDFEYTDSYSGTKPSHERVELTDGQNSVVITGLTDGTWDITAIGWVTINIDDEPDGEPMKFEAARGSEEITVTGGAAQAETIDLSAEMGTEDGYFSWDINIPGGAEIQTASLTVSRLNGPQVIDTDLVTNPTDSRGIKALESGYYLMRLSVFNGYQRTGHTEVLAVYSNMETTATYTFTGADFVPAVKMSGTVNLTNTTGVKSIRVAAMNNNGQYVNTYDITVSGDKSYPWEIYIATPKSSSAIRFVIDVYYSDYSTIFIDPKVNITLGNADYPDIDLAVNAAAITIGGTIHFTGIDQKPDSIAIGSNELNYGRGYSVELGMVSDGEADGTWSMKIPASCAGSEAGFRLSIRTGETYRSRSLGTITLPAIDTPTITFPAIDLGTVTWSGTIELTLNGSFPSGDVTINAYDTTTNSWEHLGSGQVASDGNWSITVTPYSSTKEIEFRLYMGNQGVDLGERSLPGIAQPGINFGSHSYITLGGSVAVTLNGTPITSGSDYYVYVSARPNADYSGKQLGYTNVESSGTWTMLVESSSSAQNYYFAVDVYNPSTGKSVWKGTGVSRQVSNSQVTGINLETVAFTIITLSGHIDFKINGSTPQEEMWLEIYSSSGQTGRNYLGDSRIDASGNWTITIPAPDVSTTVYFWVSIEGGSTYDTGKSQANVYQTDIPGIELGTVNKTLITLSGTVSGTVDGNPPDGCMVAAYIAAEAKVLGGASAEPDGSWSMTIDSLSSSTVVSFVVAPVVDGNLMFVRLPSTYDRTVYASDISGIDLTGLSVTTETVQITITSDGTTPTPGVVYICDSPVEQADVNNEDLLWLKVLAAPNNGDRAATWSLKVPSGTTTSMYFGVLTDTTVYVSSSLSGPAITLNLSQMTNLGGF
jgi:hypothetical protein